MCWTRSTAPLVWDGPVVIDAGDLAEEALYLGRLLAGLLPAESEAKGLLALMLCCHARRMARFTAEDVFVPLAEQDISLWDRRRIVEAEGLLTVASRAGRFGRYQCEAAIQSVQIQRPITGRTSHAAINLLYRILAASAPSLGVWVAQAALDVIAHPRKEQYQPYWVVRASCLLRSGRMEQAAMAHALELTRDPRAAAYLIARRANGLP